MTQPLRVGEAEPKLSIKEKLMVAQKTFRLIVSNTVALAVDAITPSDVNGQEVTLAHVSGRAEIRDDAGAINMSRYILEREIGADDYRDHIETSLVKELS